MNTIELFGKVRIKSENITGILLEVTKNDDGLIFAVVESLEPYSKKNSREKWPVYYCTPEDLEPVE